MKNSYEQDVGEYLLILEDCSKKVLIVSPEYSNSSYRCDVIADSYELAAWTKNHINGTYGGEKVARLTLPFWLANADRTNESVNKILLAFNQVLEPYTLDFLESEIAPVFCSECQATEEHPVLNLVDDDNTDPCNLSYVLDWKCSKGHQLRYSEHSIHVCY